MMDYSIMIAGICVVVIACIALYVIFQHDKQTTKLDKIQEYIAAQLKPQHYMPNAPKENPIPEGIKDFSQIMEKHAWLKFLKG